MKIYSFDGKKSNIDNIDLASSPMFLGQKFAPKEEDEPDMPDKNEETQEKQIEK